MTKLYLALWDGVTQLLCHHQRDRFRKRWTTSGECWDTSKALGTWVLLTSHRIRLTISYSLYISLTALEIHYLWSTFYNLVMVYSAHNKQFGSSPNKHSDKSLPVPQRQEQGTHLSKKAWSQCAVVIIVIHKVLLIIIKLENQISLIPQNCEYFHTDNRTKEIPVTSDLRTALYSPISVLINRYFNYYKGEIPISFYGWKNHCKNFSC